MNHLLQNTKEYHGSGLYRSRGGNCCLRCLGSNFSKNLMNHELLNLLEKANVVVKFTTKKNVVRSMLCTRNLFVVPESQHEGKNTAVLNQPGIVCVYDLLIKDWRAFRMDSVISYE